MRTNKSAAGAALPAWLARGAPAAAFAALVYRANSGAASYAWRRTGAFDGGSALAILRNAAAPAALAAVCGLLFLSAGAAILTRAENGSEPRPRLPEAFAMGAGICAVIIFLLGAASRLSPGAMSGLFLLLACASLPSASRWARGARAAASPAAGGWLRSALVVVLVYVFWHGLISALAPPTDADALAYHLALPKIHALAGRIDVIPWMIFSHWPHLPQLLGSVGTFAGVDSLAALLHLAAAAALVLAVFQAGRDWLGERAAWLAAAFLAAQPVLGGFAGTPRVEAWWALFGFLASVYAWRWKLDGSTSSIILAGVFAGFAASSKLMGMLSLGILAAWIALQGRSGSRAGSLRACGWYLTAGLAVVFPWYLKTWLATGNPIWPLFSSLLGGTAGAQWVEPRFLAMNRWPEPATLSMLLRNGPQFTLVPLLAAGAARLSMKTGGEDRPSFLSFLWAVNLPYVPFVLWNYEAWRYLVPTLPAMALTVAWSCDSLTRIEGYRRWIGVSAAALGLSPILLLSQNNALFAVLELRSASSPGRPPREIYIERTVPAYAFFRQVNEYFSNGAGPRPDLLLVDENYGFWLDVPYRWGSPHYQGSLQYGSFPDGVSLARELERTGITHILINLDPAAMAPLDARDRLVLKDALERRCDKILASGSYRLYRVRSF